MAKRPAETPNRLFAKLIFSRPAMPPPADQVTLIMGDLSFYVQFSAFDQSQGITVGGCRFSGALIEA